MAVLIPFSIILNIIFLGILAFFTKDLRWGTEKDRVSIIGFGFMIGTILLDILLLCLG